MKSLIRIFLMASFLANLFGGEKSHEYKTADIYRSMRQHIFDLPKENIDFGQDDRFAILMETGLEDDCYTLVSVADGSASLYFSGGGGIIGGGQDPQGAEAARAFLDFSKKFDDHFKLTKEFPLPTPGMTRFYIIKKDSVLTSEFKEEDLGEGRLPLSPLFHKGHEVITVIRQIEEKGKGEQGAAVNP